MLLLRCYSHSLTVAFVGTNMRGVLQSESKRAWKVRGNNLDKGKAKSIFIEV